LNIKRVIASAGAVAVGTAGLQGQNVTGLTQQEQTKRWIVSASLRGFYDDNSLNQVDGDPGFGFEFHPGVSFNLPLDQTLFRASYDFTLNYYDVRKDSKIDQNHTFDARLNHQFSERYDFVAQETFVYSDSPAVGDGKAVSTLRSDSSSINNRYSFDFNARLTPIAGISAGFRNILVDYDQSHDLGEGGNPSLSALLDQVEQQFHIDGQWFRSRQSILFAGYQFGFQLYTSRDVYGQKEDLLTRNKVFPDIKNNRSHYFYLGGRHEFSRRLDGTARVGVRYTDYYNVGESDLSPYIDLQGNYQLLPNSTVQLGVTVNRIPADVGLGQETEKPTLDGLATTAFTTINHQISARMRAGVSLSYQNTIYNGGDIDGESGNYFTATSNLEYKLRENFFLDLGYIFQSYSSTRGNDFTRNRVYFGIRATY